MSIFKITIRKCTISEKDILVEAESKADALEYLTHNQDWKDDGSLDSEDLGTYSFTLTPIRIGLALSLADIPLDFGKGNRAWNGTESVEVLLSA